MLDNINIDIFQNLLINIDIFQNLLINIDIFQNILIDIDILSVTKRSGSDNVSQSVIDTV